MAQTQAMAAAQAGLWVCDQCGQCDGCGRSTPSELRSHWPGKDAKELQGGWKVDGGRQLLPWLFGVRQGWRKMCGDAAAVVARSVQQGAPLL